MYSIIGYLFWDEILSTIVYRETIKQIESSDFQCTA